MQGERDKIEKNVSKRDKERIRKNGGNRGRE